MLPYPFIEHTEAGRIGLGVFGILVLFVTARMVRATPGRNWVAVVIALPAVVLLGLQALYDMPRSTPVPTGAGPS